MPRVISSQYYGVSKSHNNWRAIVTKFGKTVCVGTFSNELDAAKAYDKAAIKQNDIEALGKQRKINNVK